MTNASFFLDFADFIYDDSSQHDMHLLQILPNNVARKILKEDKYTHISDLHQSLKLDYLNVRRIKHWLTWVYKIIIGLAPKRLSRLFTFTCEITDKQTLYNEGSKLYVQKLRLELAIKTFKYRGNALEQTSTV